MMRRTIVVGDAPACGGRVLPYAAELASTIHGHPVALIGGRVYCEGCHSVGIIAKAGGPRREAFISEVALEGDVVVCHCPKPPPLISTLQTTSYNDDGAGTHRAADVAGLAALSVVSGAQDIAAAKKVVYAEVVHPPEAEQTENICPNMTNKAFCVSILDLRDRAVMLISQKRLPELERWNRGDQARVKEWFGVADQSIREYLQNGLVACERVLRGLDCKNFIRLSESGALVGCTNPPHDQSTVAMVCKPDIATRNIAFNASFCFLREVSPGADSKLSTLIHEVSHFDDTFGSLDTINYLRQSRLAATDRSKVKENADSIAGYVVWDEVFHAD
jgi:uncharacterized Zn-binding protein involved in type VI secretion